MIENPNVICNDCSYCKQNKELKERLEKTQELELEVRRESTKLKELLKECYEYLTGAKDLTMGRLTDLCNRIKEVLDD